MGDAGDAAVSDLWQAFAASRDNAIRSDLIERYQPFARRVAIRAYMLRRDNSVSFADFVQYANVGLIEAVDRFEPQRAVQFETYATHRIRGAILNGLAKESELAAQRNYWATRAHDRVESLRSEHAPSDDVDTALDQFMEITVGLAMGVLLEEGSEQAPDESVPANPYAARELAEIAKHLQEGVLTLPERERRLLEQHYFEHRAFQAIAAEWGVTKGRVSQLHSQALKRLRERLVARRAVDRRV